MQNHIPSRSPMARVAVQSSPAPVVAARLLTILAILVLAALLVSSVARAGEESVVDGVTWVKNSAEPADGVQVVELEELWRVGGADDEDNLFGVIGQILIDDEEIYLLDNQLSQINVFNHDGGFLRTLGREGDGPGEFRQAGDMCLLPDGTIGVAIQFPGRVVKIGLDDTPAGTWQLGDPTQGAFFLMRGIKHQNGVVVAGGAQQSINQATDSFSREKFLSILAEDGTRAVDLISETYESTLTGFALDELQLIDGADRRFDMLPDGRTVTCIPFDRYEVSIFGTDGKLERVFTREYESWKRNEQVYDMWRRILETIQRTQAPGAPLSWEEYEPDVEAVRTNSDGTIWILNSRAQWEPEEGYFATWDVFDSDGHFRKIVNFVGDGNPRSDGIFVVGDRAFVVTGLLDAALAQFGGTGMEDEGEEPEPMAVICYRMKN